MLEIARGIVWPLWGLVCAAGTWAYVWSVGAWTFRWSDVFDLTPIVVATILSAMVMNHFKLGGGWIGAAILVLGLLLIPAFDLLLDPGCADIDSIRVYRTDEGIYDTRCTEMADMNTEIVSAIGGAILIAFLAILLVRGRRDAGRS